MVPLQFAREQLNKNEAVSHVDSQRHCTALSVRWKITKSTPPGSISVIIQYHQIAIAQFYWYVKLNISFFNDSTPHYVFDQSQRAIYLNFGLEGIPAFPNDLHISYRCEWNEIESYLKEQLQNYRLVVRPERQWLVNYWLLSSWETVNLV